VFVISEDSDFSSEGSRSGRNWEEYFDFLRRQFHAASGTKEFQRIMTMCQDIVFHGTSQAKGKERAHDSSDSGESEINWQLEALRLSDDDEDDAHEPGFDNQDNDVFYDDINYGMANEYSVAGPSSVPQPTQSLLSMPATPQQASQTHPEPQLAQPPKRRSKVPHSTTSHADALLPLPPPATPMKSTLDSGFLSDASHNPFESSPPKKAHPRKAKRRPVVGSDEEIIVVAQRSEPTLVMATKAKKKSGGKRKNTKLPPVEPTTSDSGHIPHTDMLNESSVPPGATEMRVERIEQGPGSDEQAVIPTTTTRTRRGTWKKVAFVDSDAAVPVPKKRVRHSKR
jgi:hypothetical protein